MLMEISFILMLAETSIINIKLETLISVMKVMMVVRKKSRSSKPLLRRYQLTLHPQRLSKLKNQCTKLLLQ